MVIGVRGMAKVMLSKLRRAPVPAGAEGVLDG